MNKFKDRIAIVTGGASGIGRQLCEELCQRGAVVVVTDINIEGAQQVASDITKTGGRARAARLDVSDAEAVKKLIDETAFGFGRLDYMFNNAGFAIAGEMQDMNLEHWRSIIDVNLWGVIYGTTAAYSIMVKQGFGHIINIASLAGLLGFPMGTSYAVTKSAVIGLSTSLRIEGANLGVNVSVVCPGFVNTGIYEAGIRINIRQSNPRAIVPFKMMDARDAARIILRGVERNRSIIVFPFYARLLWWLYRLHPVLLEPLARRTVKKFRELHIESETKVS